MGEPLQLGRYSLFAELASGGMATVFLGRMNGAVGFGRTVAIKRLHPHLSRDPDFATMFLDEARLAARVQHPNVVPTLDVVASEHELFLVLEYVRGESLAGLLRAARKAKTTIPVPIGLSVMIGALNGLHAAHEAKDEQGRPLNIVHRDVSPQNIIVGADGVPRVLDFGVAKASSRLQTTREGQLKGKMAYMPPEQISGEVTRRTDIYAAGVVLWETLVGQRLFIGETEAQILNRILQGNIQPPSTLNPEVSPDLDRITLKALSKEPGQRYATAREMSSDLDASLRPASATQVAEWMEVTVGPALAARTELVAEIESGASVPGRPQVLRTLASMSYGSSPSNPSSTGSLPAAPSAPSLGPELHSSASVASLTVQPPVAQPSRPKVVAGSLAVVALFICGTAALAFRIGASSASYRDAGDHTGTGSTEPVLQVPVVTVAPPAPPIAVVAPVAVDAGGHVTGNSTAGSHAPSSVHDKSKTHPRPAASPSGPANPTNGGGSGDINSLLDTH